MVDHTLPFGKHKGKTLQQVLTAQPDYLVWLHENNILRSPELIRELKEIWAEHKQYLKEIQAQVQALRSKSYRSTYRSKVRSRYGSDPDGGLDCGYGSAYPDYEGCPWGH